MPILPRILGVDDNPRNLAILRKLFGQEFELVTAASGEEALEIAARIKPDLVLLDIMMPGLDGYETCRRLREMRELMATKIIMVSAKAMTTERLEGYAAGANDYVVKPFDPDELLAKVRIYLRLKSVEEVDRLKSDLLVLLSHETATPLTGITGALNLLRDGTSLTEEQLELIVVAESSVDRMNKLVNRVSLITQLRAGATPVVRDPLDLQALAGKAVLEAQASATRRSVRMALEPGDAVPVAGDEQLLGWVVDALLDNAIRVSAPGGLVSIRVQSDGTGASLVVSDHGPGIEPQLLPRVFDEFVVADIKHHKAGTGLSLATARLIMQHHRGTLSAESEPGLGARFQMTLSPERLALAAA